MRMMYCRRSRTRFIVLNFIYLRNSVYLRNYVKLRNLYFFYNLKVLHYIHFILCVEIKSFILIITLVALDFVGWFGLV
jgi:hypothetical protein